MVEIVENWRRLREQEDELAVTISQPKILQDNWKYVKFLLYT